MEQTFFFEIPHDRETNAKLVESIPPDWMWVDGRLHPPQVLPFDGASVQEDTGFQITRFYDIRPTIIGQYLREKGWQPPNLSALIVEQKLPGFVVFHEAGVSCDNPTLEGARDIAAGFLRKGYGGRLHFFLRDHRNNKYNNPASCEMTFCPYEGTLPAGPFERNFGKLTVTYDSEFGGKKEDVEPILDMCRTLDIPEGEGYEDFFVLDSEVSE